MILLYIDISPAPVSGCFGRAVIRTFLCKRTWMLRAHVEPPAFANIGRDLTEHGVDFQSRLFSTEKLVRSPRRYVAVFKIDPTWGTRRSPGERTFRVALCRGSVVELPIVVITPRLLAGKTKSATGKRRARLNNCECVGELAESEIDGVVGKKIDVRCLPTGDKGDKHGVRWPHGSGLSDSDYLTSSGSREEGLPREDDQQSLVEWKFDMLLVKSIPISYPRFVQGNFILIIKILIYVLRYMIIRIRENHFKAAQ